MLQYWWRTTFIAAMAVASAYASAAVFDTKGYTWSRPIATGEQSGFVALRLDRDVLDESQPSLDDLRVLDKSQNLVPHVLSNSAYESRTKVEDRPVQLINATYEAHKYARVTLDFAERSTKNEVDVHLSGANFRRRALIEGSTDTLSWETVAENQWLFDVSLPDRQFRVDTLRFPPNNFRYLRLTVYNMPDDPERIEIQQVTSRQVGTLTPKNITKLELQPTGTQQDEKTHETIWNFDLGSRNLPLRDLRFNFSDPYFYRGYELQARNSTTETVETRTETAVKNTTRETPWTSLRSGMLYRIAEASTTTENLRIDSLGVTPRHLQVRVFNADNPPLHLQGATALVTFPALIFDAGRGESYSLIGGNNSAGAPSYDLASSVRTLDPSTLPAVKLGGRVALAAASIQAPWSERHGTFLLLVLVFGVAAMLLLIFTSMRRLPTNTPTE